MYKNDKQDVMRITFHNNLYTSWLEIHAVYLYVKDIDVKNIKENMAYILEIGLAKKKHDTDYDSGLITLELYDNEKNAFENINKVLEYITKNQDNALNFKYDVNIIKDTLIVKTEYKLSSYKNDIISTTFESTEKDYLHGFLCDEECFDIHYNDEIIQNYKGDILNFIKDKKETIKNKVSIENNEENQRKRDVEYMLDNYISEGVGCLKLN